MDSDVREILDRFENLDAPARRLVYRHVLMQLRLHEWRDVRDHVDRISFHKDILGALPPELAMQITRYLGLSELHVLQRVSKGWYSLLSSDLVRDAAFRRYTGRKTDSAAAGALDKFSAYARHRTRLERGQPVWKAHFPNYQPLPKTSEVSTLDYCNGRVAWIDEENRDFFVGVRLSDRIIGATSPRGNCHIWDLHSEESAWFRLPSLQYRFFVASGTSVAFSFSDGLPNGGYVLHWEFMSHAARAIDIAPNLGYMALNAAAKTLTTVHLEASYGQLRVEKHLLDEPTLQEREQLPSYTLDLPLTEDDNRCVEIGSPDEGSSFSDRMGIFSIMTTEGQSLATCSVVVVSYDPRTDQIDLHVLHPKLAPFYPLCMTAVDQNILYYLRNDDGKPQISISNPTATVPHRLSKYMNLQLPREATSRVYSHITCFALRGDRECTLMIDENGLKVWSFNEACPSGM
ncbi:hypothetical protein P170DRAFT_147987 [Aspergillus steynii IBT 23096]|uniref:F-box domain-containing protein n=1 Tax=Aspergillus steynii IBT 23096 TaxID=1392250 RepID=A0A2I2GCF9_9EURO|nr:uncharacterized protein P170DRAFT_147987 [Aspergillus steynii IBT 23096]PLB50545.1 hypothetical protein P170DRAFT_147987 [Aspergillus steynii IBT 23096]